jgi:hypothetical protein
MDGGAVQLIHQLKVESWWFRWGYWCMQQISATAGSGNTPSTSPSQGNNGGI